MSINTSVEMAIQKAEFEEYKKERVDYLVTQIKNYCDVVRDTLEDIKSKLLVLQSQHEQTYQEYEEMLNKVIERAGIENVLDLNQDYGNKNQI